MRLSRVHSIISSLILLPLLASALTFDCANIRTKGRHYDFSKLSGSHSLTTIEETPPTIKTTTYTIDICNRLKIGNDNPLERCHGGARGKCIPRCGYFNYSNQPLLAVCSITTSYNTVDNTTQVDKVIDIAGEYHTSAGRNMDATPEPLDQGIRLVLNGGRYPWEKGRKQRAVIDFICDSDRTGLEGLNGKGDSKGKRERRSDDEDEKGDEKSLRFESYGPSEDNADVDELKLVWLTQYACKDNKEDGGKDGSHWGFFTWFIVM
jgi:hypothetical protein